MKAFGFLAVMVALACADALHKFGDDRKPPYVNHPTNEDLDTYMVTFNTDMDFIRIGEVQPQAEDVEFAVEPEDAETTEEVAEAKNYRFHIHIKKKHLKKIEKAIRDHVKVSGSANVNFSEPAMEPVPVSIEANPEDQLESGTPSLYRFKIKIPVKKIAKAIGKHVSIHGKINIKLRFASDIDFDMYLFPAETTYESHGKISMEGGASRGHGGRTEGHIGIHGSISF